MLQLVAFNLQDFDQEYSFLSELPEENGFMNACYHMTKEQFKTEANIMINHSQGIGLPTGYVPDTWFLLYDDKTPVGVFKIRHYLTESLKNGAGHIGYAIHPAYRGKGYATKGLTLAIEACKKLMREEEIYLSCYKTNAPSLAVQKANGAYIHHEDDTHYYTRIKV